MSAQIVNYRPGDEHDWKSYADCADADAPYMFPHDQDHEGIRLAKALCEGCPVRPECLEAAMAAGEPHGIWGGLTTDERRAMRRNEARRAAAGRKREEAAKAHAPTERFGTELDRIFRN